MSYIVTLLLLGVQVRKSMTTCFRNLSSVCEVIGKNTHFSPCAVVFFKNILKEISLWIEILSSVYLCDSACLAGVRPMKIHFVPHDTFHNFFFFFSPGRTQRSLWIKTNLVFEEVLEN